MGDPTEQNKGSEEAQNIDSDADVQSDTEDPEARQIEPGLVAYANGSDNSYGQNQRLNRNENHSSSNADTVHSILSSISNPNVALVIPVGGNSEGDDDIDADRMERFYSGALTAITKMRRQTMKTETKIATLRDEVGHTTMQAWTEEHYDSLKPTGSASADKR